MQDVFFKRNLEHDTWVESPDTNLAGNGFSQAPIVIVTTHYCERTGEEWCKAWCDKHQAYEDIAKYEDFGLTTAKGCKLTGLLAPTRISSYQSEYNYEAPQASPDVCYQISHCPKTGAVHITSSKVTINFVWLKDEAEDFIAIPKGFSRDSFTWNLILNEPEQPTYAPRFPAPIMKAAIEAVHHEAVRLYGDGVRLLPLPQDTMGYGNLCRDDRFELWLLALLHRPLDMNIFFFRKYFGQEKFDLLFPKTQQDNFAILAKELSIPASDEMRNLYQTNPSSIIFYLMLPELGITDASLIQKFYYLSAFCGQTMDKHYSDNLFFDPLHNRQGKEDSLQTEYEDLKFYCQWRLENGTQEELAEYLLEKQKNWRSWKHTSLHHFRQHFDKLPTDLLHDILHEGMTSDIHDKLSILHQHLTHLDEDIPFGPADLERECKINDYTFRLVRSSERYKRITRGYGFHGSRKETTYPVYVIERNGRYLATIKFEDGFVRCCNVRDHNDSLLQAKCQIAYMKWLQHFDIEEKYPPHINSYHALEQDFTIEPVDADAEWEKMSLMDLRAVPKEKIHSGYYLYFYKNLIEASLLHPRGPKLEDDEQAYWMKNFSVAKPLFEAAFSGHPEAQYVMSLLYSDQYCSYINRRLADKWYNLARENGWTEIAPAQKDIRATGFSLNGKYVR